MRERHVAPSPVPGCRKCKLRCRTRQAVRLLDRVAEVIPRVSECKHCVRVDLVLDASVGQIGAKWLEIRIDLIRSETGNSVILERLHRAKVVPGRFVPLRLSTSSVSNERTALSKRLRRTCREPFVLNPVVVHAPATVIPSSFRCRTSHSSRRDVEQSSVPNRNQMRSS